MYANDTQVYGFGRPAAVDTLSSKISECVGAVASWMESNRLSMNCDKMKLYGERQVDDNTSFRVQLCQLTALCLSP